MTTAATTELADCIATLKQAGENALTNPHVDDFLEIERYLGQLDSMVRETQQAMWSREAKDTIRRLERQEPLTPQDHDVIRTFIVSDAEHYLDQENNFGDWLNEFRRLIDEMGKRANTVDRESIGVLRGVLEDANRLVPDIRNYLEEKQRVQKFDLTQGDLDKQTCQLLARVLKEQLTSSNR